MSAWRLLVLSALVLASACAPFMLNPKLEEARRLAAADRIEDALALVEPLAREEPQNAEYRNFVVRERELAVSRWLAQADFARSASQLEDAERYLDRVLRLEPLNTRAKLARDAIRAERSHNERLSQAEAAQGRGDLATAEALVRSVLTENPQQRAALSLQRRLAERRAGARVVAPELGEAFTKPISVEFREANLRAVFEVLSRSHGINFVFDKDVRTDTRVTIFVRNTSIDEVMRLILATNQLARKVLGPTSVLIYPNTPTKQREYQDLVLRSFYLGNADAKQTLTMIKTMLKTRDVYIDEKINLLVMRDTPEVIRLAEKLIASQDMAEPEVMLDLEVLEVSRSRLSELGIRYPSQVNFGPVGAAGAAAPSTFVLSSGQLMATVANPALVLNLKLQDSSTNTLANPRIRVRNREKARVHIGEKVPVVTTTATANVGVSASVNYLEVGLKLDVEPTVHLEDEVAIKVGLEVSNILETLDLLQTRAYRLGTRNASTVLRLRDGETQVLAGLISDDDRKAGNKVPGLGELPLVGRLFGSQSDTLIKTEIVLLVTPRVVRNLNRPEAAQLEFPSGTDAAIGAAPLRLSAAGPGGVAIAPAQAGAPAVVSPFAAAKPAPAAPSAEPLAAAKVTGPGAGVRTMVLSAPPQVPLGGAFGVSLGMPTGVAAASAELELGFDASVLQVIGVGGGGAEPVTVVPAQPGRVVLRMKSAGGAGIQPVSVQFRVLASAPATTQLVVNSATIGDGQGRPVAVAIPPVHVLTLGP
ncbi:MAG: hypothetical protein IT531_05620 [Burkholderiales bacterium]|nr:hypothetical protein [Burkholderiales bacterium]